MTELNSTTKTSHKKHFNQKERNRIEFYMETHPDWSYQVLADYLGRTKSSVYSEVTKVFNFIKENYPGAPLIYDSELAQEIYYINRERCCALSPVVKFADFFQWATKKLKQGNSSPDELVGRARLKGRFNGKIPCTRTVYNVIASGLIEDLSINDLLRAGTMKPRKNKARQPLRESKLGTSITTRSELINSRREFGHWELDLIVGPLGSSSAVLLTLTERKTRFEIIKPLLNKKAETINAALREVFEELGLNCSRALFKSITTDNGSEFARLYAVKNLVGEIFYARPYCSSDKGTNENHNGIIRRYLPKGTRFEEVAADFISTLQSIMNNKPRKILKYYTPSEVFKREITKDAKKFPALYAA